jgi:hypothetical protein
MGARRRFDAAFREGAVRIFTTRAAARAAVAHFIDEYNRPADTAPPAAWPPSPMSSPRPTPLA